MLEKQDAINIHLNNLKDLGWTDGSSNPLGKKTVSFDNRPQESSQMTIVTRDTSKTVGEMNRGSLKSLRTAANDTIIVGGIPWGTLKVKRNDPYFDKTTFWVSNS